MKKPTTKRVYRYRSAVTGRFVTKQKATRYPFVTVKERVR